MASRTRRRSPSASPSCSERRTRSAALLALGVALACGCDTCNGTADVCDPTASTAQVGGIWTIEGDGERAGCADPTHNGSFKLGPSSKLAVEQVSVAIIEAGSLPDLGRVEAGPSDRGTLEARPPDVGPREARLPDLARREAGIADLDRRDGLRGDAGLHDARAAKDRRIDRPRPDRARSPTYRHVLRLKSAPAGFTLDGQVLGNCVTFETDEDELTGVLRYQFKGKASSRSIEGRFTGSGPAGCISSGTFKVEYR